MIFPLDKKGKIDDDISHMKNISFNFNSFIVGANTMGGMFSLLAGNINFAIIGFLTALFVLLVGAWVNNKTAK